MILFFAVYITLFLIVMLLSIRIAPYGYEDENGFHYYKDSQE